MSTDGRRILLAQALRAFVYGFGAVLLGVVLDHRQWSTTRVGVLLTSVLAGTALMSAAVGRYGDRIGRRRAYAALFLGLAVTGVAFGVTSNIAVLIVAAL